MTTTPSSEFPPLHEPPLPREAYTFLAQANLLRMRGCWEESVEKCMAALRLAPENASAQSLLGDIYENQGRTDDAIQWYRMALDVNPDSPADKIKLGRLLSHEPHRLPERISSAPVIPRAPLMSALVPSHSGTDAERVLRGVAWLAAALLVLAVILTGMVMAKHRPSVGPITTAPVVIAAPVAGSSSPSAATGSDTNAPQAAPTALPAAEIADPDEQDLLQTLQQDSALSGANITPVGVQIDPRQSSAVLTVLCPAPPAGISVRDALMQDAAQSALASVRAQGDRLSVWTIRCLLPAAGDTSSNAGAPSLAFVADTTSAAVSALGPSVSSSTDTQLQSAFHNLWWSPSLPQ